jgi:hypothetical protein
LNADDVAESKERFGLGQAVTNPQLLQKSPTAEATDQFAKLCGPLLRAGPSYENSE